MLPPPCFLLLDPLDWAGLGMLLFVFGGILLAFFLYLRTAYKQGGWPIVKKAAWTAIVALTLFALIRILENHAIDSFRKSFTHPK